MSKSVLRGTATGIAGFFLLVLCLQAMPISISLGQNDEVREAETCQHLRPGQFYMLYCYGPMELPSNAKVFSSCTFGTGFTHDGAHKSKPEQRCQGPIKMVMKDDGSIEYQCILCKKKWLHDANGVLVTTGDEH